MASDPTSAGVTRFDLRFDPKMAILAAGLGIRPGTTGVVLDGQDLTIRFGPWLLQTPLSNVAGTSITGPYAFVKVAGPPHLSRVDSGITFATSTEAGVCIQFHERVPAALPVGWPRHEAATVTVAEPEAFVAAVEAAAARVG